MRLVVKVASVAGAAGLLFFLSPTAAQAYCGSLCSPEAAALAAELGGTSGMVTTTAATVATTEVGAAATASGQILGISVTGGLAAVAAGLTIFGSGLPDWIWSPSTTVLPPDPTITVAGGDTVLPAGLGYQTTYTSTHPYTSTWVGGPTYGMTTTYTYNTTYSMPAHVAGTVGVVGWDTQVICKNSTPGAWIAANSGTSGVIPTNATTATVSQSINSTKCSTLGGIAQARTRTAQAWSANLVVSSWSAWQTIWAVGDPLAPVASSEIVPGRTIQQTVTCRRPDGTTYTRTSSTPADTLHPSTHVGVAGLMCDTGDAATTAAAVVKTPNAADVPITGATSFAPGWQQAGASGQTELLNTPGTYNYTYTTNNYTVTPAAATAPSDSFCGMTFGDVLNGSVMFKAVGCALSWAFVPEGDFMQVKLEATGAAWASSSVGTLVNSAAAIPVSLGSLGSVNGGCEGPTFTFPLTTPPTQIQPLNACHEPMATVAMWVRVVSTVMIVIGGVVFVLYPILRAFGMPQIRAGGSDGD